MFNPLQDFMRYLGALRSEKPIRPVSLRISESLWSALNAKAAQQRISLHAYITQTLQDDVWGSLPTSMFADSAFDGERSRVTHSHTDEVR